MVPQSWVRIGGGFIEDLPVGDFGLLIDELLHVGPGIGCTFLIVLCIHVLYFRFCGSDRMNQHGVSCLLFWWQGGSSQILCHC